jgi:two-component system sensor histidine kinase KdpD
MFDSNNSASPLAPDGNISPVGKAVEWSLHGRPWWKVLLVFFSSVLALSAVTWLKFLFDLNPITGGFLFLIIVVFSAAYGGFWSGTLTSIMGAIFMDYFYFPPLFHFNIDDPMDWVALGTFEFTALVITLLQGRAQFKAAEAVAARQESESLYNAARGILFFDKTSELGDRITALIQEEFKLAGVMLFDAPAVGVYVSGNCLPDAELKVRDAFIQNLDTFAPDTQTWFCALRAGERPVGGLALRGTSMRKLRAQAIASLCAITLERGRSSQKETHAEAARQAEQLRSAVIEALAHQIKTPLCVIQVASSSLPAMGDLSPVQAELVASIDDQSTKLNDLVTRLLGAADLETAQIKPILVPALASQLIRAAIQKVEDQAQRARFLVSVEDGEVPALADGKLMTIAFTQLVDNAVKYSVPRTPIKVMVGMPEEGISVRVQNQGGVIAPADRERIFERFYRTPEARQGPVGTGLGLSIARRIVDAHHGSIVVESSGAEGTVFEIVLPRAPKD